MSIEIFGRYENKYIISQDQLSRIMPVILQHLEADLTGSMDGTYHIRNIYYDTNNYDLIRTSMMKPRYKEKIRIRMYGTDLQDFAFLEIKKKVSGFVSKRRTRISAEDANRYIETGIFPDEASPNINVQVLREFKHLSTRLIVDPKVFLSYDRMAYCGVEDNQVIRISFDSNIRARTEDLSFSAHDYGDLLLPENTYVMEVKVTKSMPVWLTQILSENKIYPQKFSKYATQHKNWLIANTHPAPQDASHDASYLSASPAIDWLNDDSPSAITANPS